MPQYFGYSYLPFIFKLILLQRNEDLLFKLTWCSSFCCCFRGVKSVPLQSHHR